MIWCCIIVNQNILSMLLLRFDWTLMILRGIIVTGICDPIEKYM